MPGKPYTARSLSGASQYVRTLLKRIRWYEERLSDVTRERRALARLAADGSAFENDLHEINAARIRDRILRDECGLNPDGSRIAPVKQELNAEGTEGRT